MPAADILTTSFLSTVSTGPGVYQMLGKKEVLYVGKALNLRKRLASYRRSGPAHSKTSVMLSKISRIETILTTTEKEALILEASLIKKHRPRYNVILRDDKNYPLIKVTVKDKWPRVTVSRKRIRDGNRYFGPYASTSSMRETLKLLQNLFPLRRCRKVKPRSRPCLNFQLGNCLAPCAGKVDHKEYMEMVKNVLLILEGKSRELAVLLEGKMHQAARRQQFEKAAVFRDQLKGLGRTLERQAVVAGHQLDQDVFGLVRREASVGIAILFIRAGIVSGIQSFHLSDPIGDDGSLLTETILQFYSSDRVPPVELLLPDTPADRQLLTERLGEFRQGSIRLRVPRRGQRMQLMDMARQNARQVFTDRQQRKESWLALSSSLQKSFHLVNQPETIECVDISNIGGKYGVGAVVCFRDGVADKKRYRHYRIQSKETPDDYAMMREVLMRRMKKGLKEQNLPDLLLLDGGKGQLRMAQDVLDQFGLDRIIDLAAIAKEKGDEGEKIFRPGRKNPFQLSRRSPALLLLMRIRDEAHRFGITRHRKLRSRKTLVSGLDSLTGVGQRRRQLLLKSFGSLKKIQQASTGELASVPGIGRVLAQSIHQQLHRKNDQG